MSKRKRTAIGAAFSARRVDLLESPAYRVLSLSGRRIVDRVAIELCRHGGAMNGKLPVTYDDFEKYGIHRHAIGPAIREAAALGFIEVSEQGRAGNAEWRRPNKYRLTFARSDHAEGDGTHEWMRFADETEAKTVGDAARKARPENSKSQWRKTPVLSGENRHQKRPIHSTETTTTGHSTETTTTIYISGREDAA